MNETQTTDLESQESMQQIILQLNNQMNEIPNIQSKQIELEEQFKIYIKLRNLRIDLNIVKSVTIEQLDDLQQAELCRRVTLIQQLESQIQTQLNQVMPIIHQMQGFINQLDKSSLTEVRQMMHPPHPTLQTLTALEILTGCTILRNVPRRVQRDDPRRQISDISSFINTLSNFNIEQQTQAKIQEAFGYYSNTSIQRAQEASQATWLIYQWLGSCFQLATYYQTAIIPLRLQIKQQEDQLNNLQKQQDDKNKQIDEMHSLKANLQKEIEQLEYQISSTQGQDGQISDKILWLSEMSEILSKQSFLSDNHEDYKTINKVLDLQQFEQNQPEDYTNIMRILKIKKQLFAECNYYLKQYNIYLLRQQLYINKKYFVYCWAERSIYFSLQRSSTRSCSKVSQTYRIPWR